MRWDKPEYQKLGSVEHRRQMLVVHFLDGSVGHVNPDHLVPPDFGRIDWSRLSRTEHDILLTSTEGKVHEVSWFSIRALTDSAFNAFLVAKADQEARRLGSRLKQLRRARGVSGKELALRLGIKPQALSRSESGRHAISFSTLRRILAALGYSLKDLASEEKPVATLDDLVQVLSSVGVSRHFALTRLIPRSMLAGGDAPARNVGRIAQKLGEIYGWTADVILKGGPLSFDTRSLGLVRFKKYSRTDEIRATGYALYAHWLAIQVVEATPGVEPQPTLAAPESIKRLILGGYGTLSFSTLLSYVWDMGIVILPLNDPGVFHGACWRIENRTVIVLKQRTQFHARWLYDLAHELGHAEKHLSPETPTIIETREISPFPEEDEDEEVEASDFAEALILNGRAEELANLAVERAKGDLKRLKVAVQRVAQETGVSADSLANYLAFRLSMQNENWWGTAAKLQIDTPSPLQIARQELLKRIRADRLNPEDREILFQALTD